MLTHANLLAVVAGQLAAINQIGSVYGQEFTPEDIMISYLPLAHIFDRCGVLLPLGPFWPPWLL
jgi:long-subunit acyl-CoA synthetase (AMP-forming)